MELQAEWLFYTSSIILLPTNRRLFVAAPSPRRMNVFPPPVSRFRIVVGLLIIVLLVLLSLCLPLIYKRRSRCIHIARKGIIRMLLF